MIPEALDHFILWLVAPLAAIFLVSGLDDLAVDFAWLYAWVADRLTVSGRALSARIKWLPACGMPTRFLRLGAPADGPLL